MLKIWSFKTVVPLILTLVIVTTFIGSSTRIGFWAFVGWCVVVSMLVQFVFYLIRLSIIRLNNGTLPSAVDRWL